MGTFLHTRASQHVVWSPWGPWDPWRASVRWSHFHGSGKTLQPFLLVLRWWFLRHRILHLYPTCPWKGPGWAPSISHMVLPPVLSVPPNPCPIPKSILKGTARAILSTPDTTSFLLKMTWCWLLSCSQSWWFKMPLRSYLTCPDFSLCDPLAPNSLPSTETLLWSRNTQTCLCLRASVLEVSYSPWSFHPCLSQASLRCHLWLRLTLTTLFKIVHAISYAGMPVTLFICSTLNTYNIPRWC